MSHNSDNARVKDYVSTEVVSVHADDTLGEALDLMVENKVSALPVVDACGHCVGILSATDLVSLARDLNQELTSMRTDEATHQWLIDQLDEHDLGRRTVKELMTESVAFISPESRIRDAATEILRHRVHRLPVVDAKKHLLGVVSTTDLLRAFVGM